MMYRDSTAYDFDLFAPKKEVVELPDRAPKKRNTAKKSASSVGIFAALRNNVVVVGMVVAVLLLVIAQLHCQLQNSEVVDQIDTAQKTIETLQSENTRLQAELEGKVSFTNMETAAREMGMQKATVAQTRYINLCDEDATEVFGEDTGLLARFGEWF